MSAAPSVFRSLASSSRQSLTSATQISRRTLIGDTVRPAASAVHSSNTSVDPRVLNGVPSFLPKENIDRICEWQSGLWTRLQEEVRNKPELLEVKQKWDRQGLDVSYLLTQTAREPSLTLAFNYASLLLNNSYFLEGLHGDSEAHPVPEYYKILEEKVVAYAEGMVGSGWLWIVRTEDDNSAVDIFPSFSSGTLLVTNRAQRGRDDLAIFGTPKSSGDVKESESDEQEVSQKNIVGLGEGKLRAKPAAKRSTGRPVPLAVLNMFELSYLGSKYGVWSRGEYARDWFRSLDWSKVEKRAASVQ